MKNTLTLMVLFVLSNNAMADFWLTDKIKNFWSNDPIKENIIQPQKTIVKENSSWLNMDAIHEIESNQGKNPNIYNKDGSYKPNKSGALGEYQIKGDTFIDPGAGLVKLGATKLPNYMKASTAEHREFAKNYILSLEKYFRQSYTYKEKASPGLLDYEALAIAAYSRGLGTVQKLVKTHGSKLWRDHVKDDPGATETYLNKYNNFNKENNTGFKQVQKEVNNEGIA